MRPYHGGGDMIEQVSFEGTTFRAPPERFEAGTPNISGAIGMAAAIDYLDGIGREALERQENDLYAAAKAALGQIAGLRIVGEAPDAVAAISFVIDGIHPHDIGTVLDTVGIAVRTGHHCAQPLMERLGISGTTRASFAFYNTEEDIARLVDGIHQVRSVFGL